MVTGSMAGMRVQISAVAASCTARRFCRSSLYDGLLGPSLSSSKACTCQGHCSGSRFRSAIAGQKAGLICTHAAVVQDLSL